MTGETDAPQRGQVWGVTSMELLIEGQKHWLGELNPASFAINDIVEYKVGPGNILLFCVVVQKAGKNGGPTPPAGTPAPAAASPKTAPPKAKPAPAAGFDSKRCLDGQCPDGKAHYVTNTQKNRMECDCVGLPLDQMPGNICPLDAKVAKDAAAGAKQEPPIDPATQAKAEMRGFKFKPDETPAAAGGTPPQSPGSPAPVQQSRPPAPAASPGAAPVFRKAVRKFARLRVGLCGTAGSGKTIDALMIAMGIGGKIAVIDTENSSAELYAHLGEYDVCILQAPFTAQKYTDAIHAAERAGYSVIIIDSLTHAWAGEGGLLDLKDQIARNSKSGNSFTAWKDVTPLHRNLVEAMLQSPCHIIATMRSKTEYVIDTDDRGRSFPRKIGMAPIQREGMDYEFTLVFDIDANHIASASKDRTSLFTGKSFIPSIETGRQLKEWLEAGQPEGA